MGKNKQQVPRLRFPGFNDAWEQRKLGECGNTFTGLSGKSKFDFGHGSARYITYVNVLNNPIADKNIVGLVEIDDKQNQVKYGDCFFTTSSETPEEVGMSSVWLENTSNFYLNSFCFGYRPTTSFNPYYLAFMLRSDGFRKKVTFLAQGISRFNISKTKVMDLEIFIPSLKEQTTIGNFFRQLDAAIASHQRKLERTNKLKKSLLQKMFPKDGEAFPELRFPDFTDAWEQRKFKELVFLRSETVESQDYSVDIELENLESNTGRIIGNTSVRTMSNTLFKKGDILFGKLRPYLNKWRFADEEGVKSGEIWAFSCREGYSNRFIYCVIQSNGFLDEVNITSGTKMPRADWKTVSNIKITIPTIEEQTTIGNFFRQLDAAIASHQRKP